MGDEREDLDLPERRRSTLMEQHFQTLVGFILMGAISFIGWTTTSSNNEVVSLKATFVAKMQRVEDDIKDLKGELKAATTDRYRTSDAAREFGQVRSVLEAHEKRLLSVEREVTGLKARYP